MIVRCEDTATFIREICKTSQEFLNLNHEFLSCRQMLSEVRVKNLYDQSDRNSSISYERVFSYFIMASGSLLLRYASCSKDVSAAPVSSRAKCQHFGSRSWKDGYSEDRAEFDPKSEAVDPEQPLTQGGRHPSKD